MAKITDENEKEQKEFEKLSKLINISNSMELNDEVLNNKVLREIDTNNAREEQLNDVLKSFNTDFDRRSTTNRSLKKVFLIWTMILFSIIVVGCICVLILSLIWGGGIYSIAPVISSVGTLITSFIVLPKIIASYLFPEGETKDTIDLVKTIATHGVEIQSLKLEKESGIKSQEKTD